MITFKTEKCDIKGSRIVSFKGLYERRLDGWCYGGFIGDGIYVINVAPPTSSHSDFNSEGGKPLLYRFTSVGEGSVLGSRRRDWVFWWHLDEPLDGPQSGRIYPMSLNRWGSGVCWIRLYGPLVLDDHIVQAINALHENFF